MLFHDNSFEKNLSKASLKQGGQMFSEMGQIINIFSSLNHTGSVATTQPAIIVQKQPWMWIKLCSNKTLFVRRGDRLELPQGPWLANPLFSLFIVELLK